LTGLSSLFFLMLLTIYGHTTLNVPDLV
jgi:hypothetical protein